MSGAAVDIFVRFRFNKAGFLNSGVGGITDGLLYEFVIEPSAKTVSENKTYTVEIWIRFTEKIKCRIEDSRNKRDLDGYQSPWKHKQLDL